MAGYSSRDDLANVIATYVPIPMISGHKTGMDDLTFVARFKTFYLKLTHSDVNDGYRLEGYLFNADIPRMNLLVPRTSIRDFLGQFTEDNYLQGQFNITWRIAHDRDKHH